MYRLNRETIELRCDKRLGPTAGMGKNDLLLGR
jgi:hypothetical protein